MSEINTVTNNYGTFNNFSCGGLALSKWNYRTNPSSAEGITITGDTIPSDWWWSYNNQMSVYDTTSVNGSNEVQVIAEIIFCCCLCLNSATL